MIAQITPSTIISLPIEVLVGALVGIAGGLIAIGVGVAKGVWHLRGINDKLDAVVRSSWTRQEHERWAHRLERENAKIGLHVPAVETESKH